MSGESSSELSRRTFLTAVGAGVGLMATGGASRLLGGRDYTDLGYDECLARLDASLSPGQRALTVRPWDDPARQVTNTTTIFRSPHLGTLFDADQRALIERMYHHMVSDQGRDWLRNTVTLEGKLDGCVFALFSDAGPGRISDGAAGKSQAMITGGHVMLRRGGEDASGYAFGGPIAYGQQLGNKVFKVQGNAFKAHGDVANRFYEALDPRERALGREATPPHQLLLQVQGRDGEFGGVRLDRVSPAAREVAEEWLSTVLATYRDGDRRDALAAIGTHGGVGALRAAFYEDHGFYADGKRYSELTQAERDARELPYWQIWRIEGPNCVFHFQGYPHVHAYINVVRDPAKQNVGEVLTTAGRHWHGAQVRELLHAAMRREAGVALAYYAEDPTGRICPGEVTTGVVHALDAFASDIVVASIRGAAMNARLRASVESQGTRVEDANLYRVATTPYFTQPRFLGEAERVDPPAGTLRAALTRYLRDRDLDGGARG